MDHFDTFSLAMLNEWDNCASCSIRHPSSTTLIKYPGPIGSCPALMVLVMSGHHMTSSPESQDPHSSPMGDFGKAGLRNALRALLGRISLLSLRYDSVMDGFFICLHNLRDPPYAFLDNRRQGHPCFSSSDTVRRNTHYFMDPLSSWLGAEGFAQPATAPRRQRTCLGIAESCALQISACWGQANGTCLQRKHEAYLGHCAATVFP